MAEPGTATSNNDGSEALASIESVLRELEQNSPLRGATLTVELSDALVHLDVVAGDFVGQTDRQLQAVASACVSELLGDEANGHEVRWQLQADDRHLLICAIPQSQLATLEQAAATCGLRLESVQPDFALQWNVHARALKPGRGVFAVTMGSHVAIASVAGGVISAFSVGHLFTAPDRSIEGPDSQPSESASERSLAAEKLDSRIGGLLLGLGLGGHARSAFSLTQPNPLDIVEMLDSRVDRLLVGIGQDPLAQSAFVLVTPDASTPMASPRWAVMTATGLAS
jgi:hypothetical protein